MSLYSCKREKGKRRTSLLNVLFQGLTLDSIPVEILLHILSYLHILDFFTLKFTNRYIYHIISGFPRLPFSDYVAELQAEDRRRGFGRSTLAIAASRGQEALVMRLLEAEVGKESQRKQSEPSSPFHRVVGQIGWKHGGKIAISMRDESYRTPLHWAAENGHRTLVRSLIRKNVPSWVRDQQGKTALDLAAEKGHREVVRLLIEESTRINEVQSTALHAAVCKRQKEIVQLLLENGTYVDAKDSVHSHRHSSNPLHIAAMNGFEEIVNMLLDHGADLEAKDYDGRTPLGCAIAAARETTVEALLKRGASVSSLDRHREPMIHYAATAGSTTMCRMLLDHGADLNLACGGGTVMHHAARAGRDDVARFLLDKGVHVDGKDGFDATPFLCAVLCQHTSTALLLLDSGANIDSRHKRANSGTALHIFAASGNTSMTKLLLDWGAEIEARNDQGRTPLLCAAGSGNSDKIQMIRLLLDHRANIDAKDANGSTALHIVLRPPAFGEDLELLSLLLHRGANVHAADNKWQTPLHIAAQLVLRGAYELLRDHGADSDDRPIGGTSSKELFKLREPLHQTPGPRST